MEKKGKLGEKTLVLIDGNAIIHPSHFIVKNDGASRSLL